MNPEIIAVYPGWVWLYNILAPGIALEISIGEFSHDTWRRFHSIRQNLEVIVQNIATGFENPATSQ